MNKIIIDGIDVSDCNFRLERDNQQKCECCHATGFGVICDCEKWHDCYFKQQKRKEQEYEDYKIANAELEKENDELLKFKEMQEKELLKLRGQLQTLDDETITVQLTQAEFESLKAKEQECEELNKYCPKRCKSDNYEQVLESIEHICRNVLDDDYIRNLAFALLGIISKAKEK